MLAVAANAQIKYTVADLGALGGTYSGASCINNLGEVGGGLVLLASRFFIL